MHKISEKEWKRHIKGCRVKGRATKKALKEALLNAVRKNIPSERFGIMFSGGIDSTFIAFACKKAKANFICYSVGLENSQDITWARTAAKRFGFKLKTKIIDLNGAEGIIKATARLLNSNDAVRVGIGAVFYAAMETAKKDKIKYIFSGLGSEEIFAGYERHRAKDVNAECWKGLNSMWKRDLTRDWKIADKFGIKLLTPFLDADVIRLAMQTSPKRKISAVQKKIILREIAEELGIPKEFAQRAKKAAQYGSGMDKALGKIAKRKGFKLKRDYLRSLLV